MNKINFNILDNFEKLIKLENIYENKEIELCYEHLSKDELIEKGILLNNLTIKAVTKHSDNHNSYVLKLVKKKKNVETNDLSDDENLDNFNHNLFSKGSIVHFSKKRKKYILNKEKNINNSIITDIVNIYVCTVHKIKKNQISILIRNINDLCKELNVSNAYMLSDKNFFDVCLVNSEISVKRQLHAINLMKNNLENPSDILKILFLDKHPTQSPFIKEVLNIFDKYEKNEEKNNKDNGENKDNKREYNPPNNIESCLIENGEKKLNDNLESFLIENGEKKSNDNLESCYNEQADDNNNFIKEENIENIENIENYIYKCDKIEWGNKNLNYNQKKAVYFCLYSNDIFCIHGPPGTGKTTVLCEVIFQLIKRNFKILVTGPSNVSVDNILDKCIKMNIKNVVRIGLKSKIKKELWSYSYDEKIKECDSYKLCEDIDKDIEKLKLEIAKLKSKKKSEKSLYDRKSIINLKYEIKLLNKSRKKKRNVFFNELMNKNNVLLTTCSSSSNYELNKFVKYSNFLFDAVCIDECCQCTEPLCYIPISFSKKNVFLFGDHKQLSPLIKYDKNNNKLNVTLFERLIKKYQNKISFLLNIQYRMNDLILKWSNKIFYENKLISHNSCKYITVDDLISNSNEKKKKISKENNKKNKKKDNKQKKNKELDIIQNDNASCMIKNYSYYPITWIETDGFDEFLDDTNDLDMINLEIKEKKNHQINDQSKNVTKKIKQENNMKNTKEYETNPGNTISNNKVVFEKNKNNHNINDKYDVNNDNKKCDISNIEKHDIDNLKKKYNDNYFNSNDSEEFNEVNSLKNLNDNELNDIVKIDIDDIINLNNKSRSNSGEAYVIYKLIERMVKINNINTDYICIITPYSKQMNLLRNIFYDNFYDDKNYTNIYKNIEISTVDSFQGREKEIVILSLVCSNYFKNIGFLKDYRRLNVAITRAKRHVVVVGNSNTISNDTVLNELYETILTYGKIYLVNEIIDVEQMIMNN
ncbi:dna2/nam7 helicase family member, putative [Plasmodium gallinaceum]|uniref:Dna2/nam7 helicase family member, putative n=1 Tax=Plasmodium gallinaceum TaxID=5849 RepID=A0A1J1GUG4_PLAGA|nr:dna2/nam7 helicase family member, putative [Plasmodium gallinaceum]CRG96125.1 dna2/nam7 helicase family member, putative [Plasmodium gallinaceum]